MVKKYNVKVNGKSYEVEVEEITSNSTSHNINATRNTTESLPADKQQPSISEKVSNTPKPKNEPNTDVSENNGSQSNIDAPMSGLVIDVKVKKGDNVKPGDKLLILEAMKMENDIVSDITGIVDEIHCKKGDNVETGETLITIS